jgi:hypothetical protein
MVVLLKFKLQFKFQRRHCNFVSSVHLSANCRGRLGVGPGACRGCSWSWWGLLPASLAELNGGPGRLMRASVGRMTHGLMRASVKQACGPTRAEAAPTAAWKASSGAAVDRCGGGDDRGGGGPKVPNVGRWSTRRDCVRWWGGWSTGRDCVGQWGGWRWAVVAHTQI